MGRRNRNERQWPGRRVTESRSKEEGRRRGWGRRNAKRSKEEDEAGSGHLLR